MSFGTHQIINFWCQNPWQQLPRDYPASRFQWLGDWKIVGFEENPFFQLALITNLLIIFAEVWKGTKIWGIFTSWPSKASTTFDNCAFDEYSLKCYVITRKLYFYSTRDLSGTSIESLPSTGLDKLEELRIQNTQSLKHIPSVYNFKVLQVYPMWDSAIYDKVL